MEGYYQVGKIVIVFSLAIQVVMLFLQAAALQRHKHVAFWLLCFGSALGALYAVLVGAPYFFSFSEDLAFTLFKAGTLCGAIGAVLGVCGTVMLFHSYRLLSEAAARPATDDPQVR